MRMFSRVFPLLLALCGLVSSALAGGSAAFADAVAKSAYPEAGKEYYARHCFMYEDGTHITTNYWRGTLVPINAKITVVVATPSKLVLKIEETGETVKVDNAAKYTKCDMREISRRMLSADPIDLDDCDEDMANAIRSGTMRLGMTKDEVLMARGFPPAHKTPSLTGDRWQYWSSRYAVHTLVFADGKLVEGRGIN